MPPRLLIAATASSLIFAGAALAQTYAAPTRTPAASAARQPARPGSPAVTSAPPARASGRPVTPGPTAPLVGTHYYAGATPALTPPLATALVPPH